MKRKLSITAGVKLRAAAADSPKRRRFAIVAYTGAPLLLENWEHPVYIDLAGLTANSQLRPALYRHNPTIKAVVGQIDRIHNNAPKDLVVEGFFLRSTAVARDVLAMAEDGFTWQASVGCDVHEAEEVREGQTGEVNGQTVEGPCFIARRSTLGEVSFCVLGADDRTSARITAKRARASRLKGSQMNFEAWLQSLGLDAAALSTDQLAQMRQAFDSIFPAVTAEGEEDDVTAEGDEDDVTAEDDDVTAEDDELLALGEGDEDLDAEDDPEVDAEDEETPLAARNAKAKANRRRQQLQAKKAKARKAKAAKLQAARKPVSAYARSVAAEARRVSAIQEICANRPKLLAAALERGWTADKARLEVLRASRAKAPLPQRRNDAVNTKVIEAALMLTAAVPADDVAKFYGQKVVNQAMEKEIRGASLHFAMDRVIEASGGYYRGHRKSDSFIRAALDADRKIRASGGSTTLSLASILENVAHKALISSYEAIETTWSMFCAPRTHADFKVHSRYRLDVTGSFRKVGADGELKHIGLSDAKFTNQLDTFGAIVTLTRQMQYNDDLDAFLELPRMLGRLSALAIEEAVYVLLLSNPNNFFHADNRNVAAGVFGIAGLTALENVFRNQVDGNKKPILVSPQILLVPTTLKVDADNIYEETTVNETTTADKAKPARNPHKGKYKPVTSPYLNNTAIKVLDEAGNAAAIAGQSSIQYYQFADPAARAAMGVGFLNGVQQPTIESAETDFTKLGMQWRSYMDFGVGMEDPVAAARSTGA